MDRADISKPRPVFLACWGVLVALYALIVIIYPDKFFAEDSYFYFQVAWNFARGAGSTFNNFMPTNGYHPLWMLLCAAVFKVMPAKTAAVHGIAFVICALDALMLLVVARLLARAGGAEADTDIATWWAAYFILIPFSFLSQLGTEGALSGFLLALFALQAYRFAAEPTGRNAFACHLVGALAVLARLDNIFIVAFVWLCLLAFSSRNARRLQLACIPVYLALWGAYLFTNEHYFHVLQPISGMLKSTGQEHHRLFSNLPPHTAWAALAVLIPCFLYLAALKRDLFFRVVELPFTLGVLCHGAYIVLRMSSETRWSWYFTSWMLIAGIMAARVVADLALRLKIPAAKNVLAYACLLALALVWIKGSYLHYTRMADTGRSTEFEDVVAKGAGITSAVAFDYPGRLAFYSDVHILPLDGLMGDLNFQHQLAAEGIQSYIAAHHIQAFIGPAIPMDDGPARDLCNHIHNGAVQFSCVETAPGVWDVTAANVYTRIPHAPAGTLPLRDADIVWTEPGVVSVWRIDPGNLPSASP